jgi:hypothetical protein
VVCVVLSATDACRPAIGILNRVVRESGGRVVHQIDSIPSVWCGSLRRYIVPGSVRETLRIRSLAYNSSGFPMQMTDGLSSSPRDNTVTFLEPNHELACSSLSITCLLLCKFINRTTSPNLSLRLLGATAIS